MLPDVQTRNTTPPTPPAQPAPPVAQPPVAPPAATGQHQNWFRRTLAVLLAIGGGVSIIYAFHTVWWSAKGVPIFPDWLIIVAMVGSLVLAVAAAALLRSWWALIIVPAAFFVGGQLALLMANGFNLLQWSNAFGYVSFSVLVFALPPAIIGTVIGVPIGKRIDKGMRR